MMIVPAEVFSVAEYIQDELDERGWDLDDLASKMGGQWDVNRASLDFLFLEDRRIILDRKTAEGLGRAFGMDPRTWLNLDATWRKGLAPVAPKVKGWQP